MDLIGIPLAQRPVSEKMNEIPVATQILQAFDVAGKVVTISSAKANALHPKRAYRDSSQN